MVADANAIADIQLPTFVFLAIFARNGGTVVAPRCLILLRFWHRDHVGVRRVEGASEACPGRTCLAPFFQIACAIVDAGNAASEAGDVVDDSLDDVRCSDALFVKAVQCAIGGLVCVHAAEVRERP